MKIYLDTKDLISIFEKSNPYTPEEFKNLLKSNGHELIISFLNVIELSRPLLNRSAETNVMRLLNFIQSLPIRFIANIVRSELIEAYKAFRDGREYEQTCPFVGRFDEAVSEGYDSPTTKHLLN